MSEIQKVAVFGLDCAEPSLVFDASTDLLPNTKRLSESGTGGMAAKTLAFDR